MKISMRKKNIVIAFSTCLILFSQAPFVQAQTVTPKASSVIAPTSVPPAGINLSLSPTYITVLTLPGEEVSSEFRLRNNNTFAEHLQITLAKFTSSENGRPVIADLEDGDDYASWLSVSDEDFIMQPSQNKTISFTITPPDDAALGYYYALVVSRITDDAVKKEASIEGSIALPVLLDVKSPNAKRELQLVDFSTDKLFYEHLPAVFNLSFKNSGNIHVVPVGDIFIDSMWNKDVAVIPVNEGRGNVLPGGERVLTNSWNDGFITRKIKTVDGVPIKTSKGENEYETVYDFASANKFRFGRYTAHALVVYDNGERDIPMEATVSFWIIPWKIVGGVGLVVLLAVIGIIIVIKGLFKKILRK